MFFCFSYFLFIPTVEGVNAPSFILQKKEDIMKRYKKLLSLILAFVITLQGIIFKPIVSYANTVQT